MSNEIKILDIDYRPIGDAIDGYIPFMSMIKFNYKDAEHVAQVDSKYVESSESFDGLELTDITKRENIMLSVVVYKPPTPFGNVTFTNPHQDDELGAKFLELLEEKQEEWTAAAQRVLN